MILHIDMDAFYASVEQLDNPDLRGKPVMVGGYSNRGVVTAASYEARKFGVHSAMPMFKAKKLCPQGIVVPGRMERYSEISKKVFSLLETLTPLVEPVSIDEAYVDLTGCERILGTPQEIALNIKQRIKEAVDLSCSIGIAPVKFLAKIASEINKPDGLTIITPDQVLSFIESLPIRKVPGVGKVMLKTIAQLGIKTLGDINKFPEKMIRKRFGKFGRRLISLSKGSDDSAVTPHLEPKSVSTESTLSEDTNDLNLLRRRLLKASEQVGRRLRKYRLKTKTISIKIKLSDFKQITRSVTIKESTGSSKTIYHNASALLDEYRLPKKVRLIGVGASNLVDSKMPSQLGLFNSGEKKDENWEKVEKAIDDISSKFGKNTIKKATLF